MFFSIAQAGTYQLRFEAKIRNSFDFDPAAHHDFFVDGATETGGNRLGESAVHYESEGLGRRPHQVSVELVADAGARRYPSTQNQRTGRGIPVVQISSRAQRLSWGKGACQRVRAARQMFVDLRSHLPR